MKEHIVHLLVVGLLTALVVLVASDQDGPAPAAPATTPGAPATFDLEGFLTPELVESLADALFLQGVLPAEPAYGDPVLESRKVFLNGSLDARLADRVMKELAWLDTQDPGKPIDLYVDTQGGMAGYLLAHFLQTLRSPVNTIALDYCASAGAIVLAAGTGTRSCYASSRIILHFVTEDEWVEDHPDFTTHAQNRATRREFWRGHAKIPEEYLELEGDRFLNLTPKQALEYGIVDEVRPERRK